MVIKSGYRHVDVAKRFGVDNSSISNWVKSFKTTGEVSQMNVNAAAVAIKTATQKPAPTEKSMPEPKPLHVEQARPRNPDGGFFKETQALDVDGKFYTAQDIRLLERTLGRAYASHLTK